MTKTGCSDKRIVELATVVNLSEPIQKRKCSAKKVPEATNNMYSFNEIFFKYAICLETNGIMSINVNKSLYMPCTETGADDHFTNIDENDIAIMPTASGIITGTLSNLLFKWCHPILF
jgi:hypothetical protein